MWHFPDELRADRVDDDLSAEVNTHPLRAGFDLHAHPVIHGFISFVANRRLNSSRRQAIVLHHAEPRPDRTTRELQRFACPHDLDHQVGANIAGSNYGNRDFDRTPMTTAFH